MVEGARTPSVSGGAVVHVVEPAHYRPRVARAGGDGTARGGERWLQRHTAVRAVHLALWYATPRGEPDVLPRGGSAEAESSGSCLRLVVPTV
jgi:hypothetical protein